MLAARKVRIVLHNEVAVVALRLQLGKAQDIMVPPQFSVIQLPISTSYLVRQSGATTCTEATHEKLANYMYISLEVSHTTWYIIH